MLEGSIRHQQQRLELIFNQPFAPFTAGQGFTVQVNEQPAVVESVQLKEGEERTISLLLQTPVLYKDQLLVSYSGTAITAASGVALAPITDLPVQVGSDGNIRDVPGRIQAEEYNLNQGFQTETTSDTGGGLNIGYTDAGDYLEYQVYVDQEGVYTVNYRVAAQSDTRSFKLQLAKGGGWQDLDEQTFAATGGWQSWKTISGQASLPQGLQQLRLLAGTGSFNLNWLELSYLRPTGLKDDGIDSTLISLFPNPSRNGSFQLKFKGGAPRPQQLVITDLAGKTLLLLKPGKGVDELLVQHRLQKGLYLVVFEVAGKRMSRKLVVE